MGTPLSESLAAGDREAFAALYDRLGLRLLRTARTMLASTAEAEDVVHDLFVELARFRHRLAAEKVPATKDGWSGDFVAVTAFSAALGIALAVALLAVAPRPHTGPLPKRADDTFVNQTTLRVTDARRLLEENL